MPGRGRFVELRIHGVGQQEYLNSIMSPLVRRLNPWTEAAEPPVLPRHSLSLINWSRSNRRRTGFLWYLVFPFTLANVAGRMIERPAGPTGTASLNWWLLQGVALLFTLTQLAWLTVLGETLLKHLAGPLSVADTTGAVRVVPVAAALLMAGFLGYRWVNVIRRQEEQRRRRAGIVAAGHAAALLVTGVVLAVVLPGQAVYRRWPSSAGPDGLYRLDAMAAWVAGSLLLVLALGFLAALGYWLGPRPARGEQVPLLAAMGLLTIGLYLMHTVNALVRMVLDNLLGYVVGLFGGRARIDAASRVLLAWDNPADAGDSRLDLFPLLALLALLGALAAAVLVLLREPSLGLSPLWGGRRERLLWGQRIVQRAPAFLPVLLPLASVLGLAGMAAAVSMGEGRLGGPWLALAILLLQVAGAVVVLTLLLGQLRLLQEVLGKVADAAGFWPVRDHPLSGASYRDAVIAGIGLEAEKAGPSRVALVAHSQGGVICAWLIAHTRILGRCSEVHLVTTGSPLGPFYSVFFPAYFPEEWFRRLAERSTSWVNFWRDTDPLAAPVRGAANVKLPDPDEYGVIRGHEGYWNSREILSHVEALADEEPISPYRQAAGTIDPT